jgi:hypothetical protein
MAFAAEYPAKAPDTMPQIDGAFRFCRLHMTRNATVHGRSLSALEIPAIN